MTAPKDRAERKALPLKTRATATASNQALFPFLLPIGAELILAAPKLYRPHA